MTRATTTLLWAVGILAAAFTLTKDHDPIPWAVGVLGAVVGVGAGIGVLIERDRAITAANARARAEARFAQLEGHDTP